VILAALVFELSYRYTELRQWKPYPLLPSAWASRWHSVECTLLPQCRYSSNHNHNSNLPKYNQLFTGPKSTYSPNFTKKSPSNLLSYPNRQTLPPPTCY